jgi:hypothetical protein
MIEIIEKSWLYITLLLLAILFFCLLYIPDTARIFGPGLVIFSVGMALLFAIRKHWQIYKKGQIERSGLWRNIIVEMIGILLMVGVSIWAANLVTPVVSGVVREAIEPRWAGWGAALGLIAGLLSSIAIGLSIGLILYSISKRLIIKPN